MLGYWLVETLWRTGTSLILEMPFFLLVGYFSYNWVIRQKDEESHWIQEAHMLAITWVIPTFLIEVVYAFGYIINYILFHDMRTLAVKTTLQPYAPVMDFLLLGLLSAPIIAYRYNLRLHGNKILNGITGWNRWLLLGFQLVLLEAGSLFISRFILHLPAVELFHQSLARFWVL
jgi:hypothetical protein